MSRRFRLPALAALWAICATGLGALPPGARAADPPAAPGASSPYLVAEGDGVLATWVEPLAGGGGRLRLSRLAGDGWEPAVTVAESPALLASRQGLVRVFHLAPEASRKASLDPELEQSLRALGYVQ